LGNEVHEGTIGDINTVLVAPRDIVGNDIVGVGVTTDTKTEGVTTTILRLHKVQQRSHTDTLRHVDTLQTVGRTDVLDNLTSRVAGGLVKAPVERDVDARFRRRDNLNPATQIAGSLNYRTGRDTGEHRLNVNLDFNRATLKEASPRRRLVWLAQKLKGIGDTVVQGNVGVTIRRRNQLMNRRTVVGQPHVLDDIPQQSARGILVSVGLTKNRALHLH